MISRAVEAFHLCHVEGKLEEDSIVFHHLKISRHIRSSSLLLALPTALKAFKLCRKHGIDVIYILDGIYYELTGLLTSLLSRKPLVFRMRTNEVKLRQIIHYNIVKKILGDFITRLVVAKAKRVACISHELRNLLSRWGVSPSKMVVVYHGVDSEKFKPLKVKSPFPNIVLFVGRFDQVKGAFTLLEVAKDLENIQFFMLGSQPNRLQLPENVHCVGLVKRNQMPYYYNISDVLVVPSLTEGFGDVILEAFACGKPVIASKVADMPQIVSPEFGWLVEPKDAKNLKKTILTAFSDKSRLRAMGKTAREYVVENFKWVFYTNQIIQTFHACTKVN